MTYIARALLTLSLTTLTAQSALAQNISGIPAVETQTTDVYLGGAVFTNADYVGADETELRVLPYFEVYNYHGFDFRPFALTYDLIETTSGKGLWATGFKAGASANLNFGRNEDDADELSGLGDLDTSILAGGYATLRLGPVALRLEGGQDIIDGHGGAQFDASIGTRIPVGEGSITAALTTRWGSEDHNQSYFAITDAQAAASLYEGYEIGGGVFSNGATLLLSYPVADKWSLTALTSYQKYTGDAANSPIITADTGSDTAVLGIIALSRKFSFGG